jgi:hypothetical protein
MCHSFVETKLCPGTTNFQLSVNIDGSWLWTEVDNLHGKLFAESFLFEKNSCHNLVEHVSKNTLI